MPSLFETDESFARAQDMLCALDRARAFVRVNPRLCAALGWSEEELRGRALAELVHAEDRAHVAAVLDAVGAADSWIGADYTEARVQTRGGEHRWLRWTFAWDPERGFIRARAEDVSAERRRALELDRFFALSLDMFGITDRRGRFQLVNPAFAQTLGWSEQELLDMPMRDLVHPDDLQRSFASSAELFRDDHTVHLESRCRTRAGAYKWIAWNVNLDEETGAIYAAGRDISRLKELLEELRQAKEAAEQAMSVAEAAGRTRSKFLSNMSHELRTPLNGILGYAQLLALDLDLSDKQREGIDAIRRSGEHLLVLINDMLDLAKMEAGTLPTTASELHLGDFLSSIASMFEARARSKRIGFGYEAVSELPEVIRCDETRLRQVLVNLLSHAIRSSEHGGVFLSVGFLDGALRFRIEDVTSGVSSARIDTFFDPLEGRGDPGAPVAGTALELPARLLVSMDGTLVVERHGDSDSVFWVEISPEVVTGWTRKGPAPRVIEGYEGALRTVLVADDKRENRGLLSHLLAPLGFSVVQAANGEEALRVAADEHPDIILMDLVMPVLDGFEATRRLRAREAGTPTPIVAMSSSTFEPELNRSREAGCDGFLAKPVRRDKLLAALERHLGLEWRYRESRIEQPGARRAQTAPPVRGRPAGGEVSLSAAQLQAIYDAASIGDIRAILTIVEGAGTDQGETPAGPPGLVEEIYRLAKRFQARKIKERVKPFLG